MGFALLVGDEEETDEGSASASSDVAAGRGRGGVFVW